MGGFCRRRAVAIAYTTPPTFIPGDPLAADDLNILGDDIEYLKGISDGITFSGVQVSRNTTQAISDDTDTNIQWNVQNLDIGAWWSSGENVVVPAGAIPSGFTQIQIDLMVQVNFAADDAGKRRVSLLLNGTPFGGWKVTALDDDVTSVFLAESVTVEAGDLIKTQVWQNSGASLNITTARLTVERRGVVA